MRTPSTGQRDGRQRPSAIICDYYRTGPINQTLAIELAKALILVEERIQTNAFFRTHPKGLPRPFVEILAGSTAWSIEGRTAQYVAKLAARWIADHRMTGVDRTRVIANLFSLEAAIIDAGLHALIEERCA